jgi:hypothetical protein
MLLGDAGCKMRRIENPRVGGSIPPLATIQIMVLSENDTDVKCPIPKSFSSRPEIDRGVSRVDASDFAGVCPMPGARVE